jgi:hypothetical protein
MGPLDLFDVPSGILVVFVSVVFVNAPTVFRIVRGLAMDIKTRDYVAAAQTRGEVPWYIMLWEILPNARGPLIVDFCLRIGYTTILLGTLGFFGLACPPTAPTGAARSTRPPAPVDLPAPRPRPGRRAAEPRPGPQPSRGRPARGKPEGLTACPTPFPSPAPPRPPAP